MRLKEPLYGIRVAQLHVLIHFGFAIQMILLDMNVITFSQKSLRYRYQFKSLKFMNDPALCESLEKKLNIRKDLTNIVYHTQDALSNKTIYQILLVVHILSFILMFVEQILIKYRLLLVCKNFLRSVPINLFYLTTLIYCIFKNNLKCKYSDDIEDYIYEVWIKYEITIFFCWIKSSMVFLFFVYISKFKSHMKDLEEALAIEDVWDSKNSKDILHYFKFESDFFSLCICFLINDLDTIYKILSNGD